MSNFLEGKPLAAAYQLMNYDAVTIGNHEFDWGIENMIDADKTMQDYQFGTFSGVNNVPVVVSNLYLNDEPVEFADDMLDSEGAVVGLTEEGEANNGYLDVDSKAYFINKPYASEEKNNSKK